MGGGFSTRGPGRRRRADGGASLVEFALLVPVLFMLLLGIITGGLTLSRQNSVENAVREGTRFGAIYPAGNVDYLQQLHEQTIAAATGDLGPGADGRFICVAYIDDDDDESWKMRRQTSTAPAVESTGEWGTDGVPCFDDGRSGLGEARVQVLARRKSDIKAILYSQTVTLESRSATRYER